MVKCCAIGCLKKGIHNFPKNLKLRKLWEEAIDPNNFQATKNSRLCCDHFKPEDYQTEGYFSGLPNTRKILKKHVVPSLFPVVLSSLEHHTGREFSRLQPQFLQQCFNKTNVIIKNPRSLNKNNFEECTQPKSFQSIGTQKNFCFYTVERFRNDDYGIVYYTGLLTFKMFSDIFQSLCPEANAIRYSKNTEIDMTPEDQFFLTLIKLRKDTDEYELGLYFEINKSSINDIFITWIHFLHQKWKDMTGILSKDTKSEITDPLISKPKNQSNASNPKLNTKKSSLGIPEGNNQTYCNLNVNMKTEFEQMQEMANIYTYLKQPSNKLYESISSKVLLVCRVLCNYRLGLMIKES